MGATLSQRTLRSGDGAPAQAGDQGVFAGLRSWGPYAAAYLAAALTGHFSPELAVLLCGAVVVLAAWREPAASLFLLVLQLPIDRLFQLPEGAGLVLLTLQIGLQIGTLVWHEPELRRDLVTAAFWRERVRSGAWLLIAAYCVLSIVDVSPGLGVSFRLMTVAFAAPAFCLFTLYDGQFTSRDRSALVWALVLGLSFQLLMDKAFIIGWRNWMQAPETLDFDPVINGRLMGMTLNANQLAEFCLAAFAFVYARFVLGRDDRPASVKNVGPQTWWMWIAPFLGMVFLYAGISDTASKGAIAASLGVMALLAVLQPFKRLDGRALRSAIAVVACVAVFVGVVVAPALVPPSKPIVAGVSPPATPPHIVSATPVVGRPTAEASSPADAGRDGTTQLIWYQSVDRSAGRTSTSPVHALPTPRGADPVFTTDAAPTQAQTFVALSAAASAQRLPPANPERASEPPLRSPQSNPSVQPIRARQVATATQSPIASPATLAPALPPAPAPVMLDTESSAAASVQAAVMPAGSAPSPFSASFSAPPANSKSSDAGDAPTTIRVNLSARPQPSRHETEDRVVAARAVASPASAPKPVRVAAPAPIVAPAKAVPAPEVNKAAEPTMLQRRLRLGIETAPMSTMSRQDVHFGADTRCEGICGGMRAQLWQAGWQVVKRHWILGIGFGGWRFELQPLLGYAYSSPHNAILHLWGMFGLPGLALAICSWLLIGSRAVRYFMAPRGSLRAQSWVLASAMFLLIVAFHELIETTYVLSLSRIGIMCWLMLALQGGAFLEPAPEDPPIAAPVQEPDL